jgi:hypothetical protein
MVDMEKIYVVNFNDEGPVAAYLDKEQAKREMWQSYMTDWVPVFNEADREAIVEEDRKTFEESDYIVDIGWITEVPLVVD